MRVRERGRRALSFLLALVLALSLLPASALAAETEVATDEKGTSYRSVSDAWDAAKNGHVITMLSDWTGMGRLKLEDGKTAVINMNGKKIDRGRTSSTGDGEVIWVGKNASLTLKGGSNTDFNYKGWDNKWGNEGKYGWNWLLSKDDWTIDKKTPTDMTITAGGLITGGWSDNGGGGIHMKEGASLTLDNVAVAGNFADRGSSGKASYGGGIQMDGKNGQIILKNGAKVDHNLAKYGGGIYAAAESATITMSGGSEISDNYAEMDGGGIYSNDNKTVITMSGNAAIERNSAIDGGGIYFNYTSFVLKSTDATGSISNNIAYKRGGGDGGAVCIASKRFGSNKGTISGITFDHNIGTSDGGAIYIHQENIAVSNCKVTFNKAYDSGGGIYVNNDGASISNTTITDNSAEERGGGVYVDSFNDITLSGKVIVEENTRNDSTNSKDDLYPQVGLTSYSNILGSPSGKSRIGVRTENAEERSVGVSYHYVDERVFFSDFDDYTIKFDGYGLKQVKGSAAQTTEKEEVSSPGTTPSGTYKGKDVLRGYFSYPSVVESDEDLDSVFYYSDGYFLDDPKTYNEHLATMSMTMAMAAFYSNIGNDGTQKSDDDDRTYTYKSQNIEKLLTDIGVASEDIYISDSNTVKPGTDTIGVAIGQKTIQDGDTTYTLVPIAVRGAGYESEWYSNTTVGESGEHKGFASAADQVFQQVKSYINNYNLTDAVEQGKVKFWIAGYSRAGATANLTAKRLIEAYCYNESQTATGNQVYAYCFEAPKGGMNSEMKLDESAYYCIHNCINKADLVPLVAPEEMGFIRYGVDHYVPGEATAGSVKENTTVWSYVKDKKTVPSDYKTWYDNSSYTVDTSDKTDTSTSPYKEQRSLMLKQLDAVDPVNIYFFDTFKLATINYVNGAIGASDFITSCPGHLTQEAYGKILLRSLQSWGFYRSYEGDFRHGYTGQFTISEGDGSTRPSFQQALQTVTKLIFSKSASDLDGMMTAASGIADRLSTDDFVHIWYNAIGSWTTMSQSLRDKYLQQLWDAAIEGKSIEGKSVADYLTPAEKAELRSVWDVLLDVLLRFVEVDYNTKTENWNESTTAMGNQKTPILEGLTYSGLSYNTQVVLGTLVYNASALMQAHYPEINFAWLRSYDDFYTKETKSVKITATETPEVINTVSGGAANSTGAYEGDRTLTLSTNATQTSGAGIYYRIKAASQNSQYGDWMPYNQPINLTAKNKSNSSSGETYTVQTTAVYCGNTSAVTERSYTIIPVQTYFVHVNGTSLGEFKAGDTVTIDGTPINTEDEPTKAESQMFKCWENPKDAQNNDISNLITENQKTDIVTTFTMPAQNVYIKADYYTRISNVELKVEKPEAGKQLNMEGKLIWGEGEEAQEKTVSVAWVKKVGNGGQPVFRAEYGETYYPVVAVDQDLDNNVLFMSNLGKGENDVILTYTGLEGNQVDEAYVDAEGGLVIYGSEVTTEQAEVTNNIPSYAVKILKNSVQTSDELKSLLPKNVTVETNDGNKTLKLNYTQEVLAAALNAVKGNAGTAYDATATVDYTGTNLIVSDNRKTTTIHITIYTNGTVAEPTADKASDSYQGESLKVNLETTTEGATIKYKVDDGQETEYNSTTGVVLNCDEGNTKTYTITAWAEKDTMDKSSEVTFTYTLTNPLPTYTVTIKGIDTGLKQTGDGLWTKRYTYTKGEMVTIGAPAEEDEVFEKWEVAENSGITINSGDEKSAKLPETEITGNITLTAVYNPVVKQLDVEMVAPAIGTKLAENITDATATVTKENDVTKLFNKITWTPQLPASGTPAYNTAYTAKLTLNESLLTERHINFFLSENMTLNVPGASTATVVKETSGYAVYVTFPKTEKVALKSVEEPADRYVTREEAGSSTWGLPNTTTLTLVDGTKETATITWKTDDAFHNENLDTQALDFYGDVTLPENVERGNVPNSLLVTVFVAAADQVAAPTASLSSGSYTGEQVLRLNCDTEGATIYYTLDGSDPSTSSTEYTGGVITLDNTTKVTELHAIAVKDGLRDSTMSIYRYDVTRKSSSGGSSKPDQPADQPTTGGSDYKSCKHDSTCPLTKFTDLDATAWYHDGVHYCLDSGLMAGYGDALFGPSDKLSRAQVVTVLWRMAKSPAPTAENSFSDVPADTWYTDAVRWAAENGVVGGYGDGRFGPNDPVTREQMAAMFYRFAKQQGQDVSQSADLGTYADAASVSDWAKEALQWACGAGLINGMDGSLVPQGTATRAQTAAVLQRLSTLTK